MQNSTQDENTVKAAFFVSGNGEWFAKDSTVERDDTLAHLHTDKEKLGFFFVLAGQEVSEQQVQAVQAFAEKLSKCMNGLSDDTGIADSNRTIIYSRTFAFCKENGFGLYEPEDKLPKPFRREDIEKRAFIFQPDVVG